MSLINICHLTFSYEGSFDTIFEDVSFQIDTDWKLGFIGRNGRGKTTFLQLLTGKYGYSGSISKSGVEFGYFPFTVADPYQNTLEIAQDVLPCRPLWQITRELSLLDLDDEVLYRPFITLSQGEQTKVLLAVLFLKENCFLLIDEPTNHLDASSRQKVCSYLKNKKGFILVSHDRAFLDGCVDHILSINRSNLEIQKGNFSSWYQNKQQRDHFELAENEKLKKEINRLNQSARRTANWSNAVEKTKYGTKNSGLRPDRGYIGHKSAKMMQRTKAIEQRRQSAVESKQKLLKNLEQADSLSLHPLAYHTNRLAVLQNVSIFYKQKLVCKDVSFTITQGDRIALQGKNGSGKSSVLKLINGTPVFYTGSLHIGSQVKISYVPQDTSFLQGDLSSYAAQHQIDESLFKAILRKLDFARTQFEKDMHTFSAGQKKKVLLAKSLCERAHLYIWDEPLNYIDVFYRMQIEALLKSCAATVLFVEHDLSFTENIATRIIRL